jgi:hypothetical protein
MRRRRPALILLFLLAAGLLWWRNVWRGPVSGDLLLKDPAFIPPVQAVRKGRLLWVDTAHHPTTFLAQQMDMRGGKTRDLVRRELKHEILLQSVFTDKELLYLTASAFPRGDLDASAWVVDSSGRRLYISGPFLMPAKADAGKSSGAWRVIPRISPRNQPAPTLHRISLETGGERTVPLDTQGYFLGALPFILSEEGIFWLRPGTQTRTVVLSEKERTAYELLPPRDDLMATPLDGGPAHAIARGVLLGGLDARGDGIYGARPATYPDVYGEGDLFRFAQAGEQPATRLPYGMRVGGPQRLDAHPGGVESDGRYYWLSGRPEGNAVAPEIPANSTPFHGAGASDHRTITSPIQLMSCRVDGSDTHTVCALVDKQGESLYPKSLFTYQGRPYLICSRIIMPRQGAEEQGGVLPQVIHYSVRIHPEAADPLGGIRQLGVGRGDYSFSDLTDDGYYYFSLNDTERSAFDLLSPSSTERHVTSFWRVRLPE